MLLGGALLFALGLSFPYSAQAARCDCSCNDETLQENAGTVTGACVADSCTAICSRACTTHRGVSVGYCNADDPTVRPAPASGALCGCSCGTAGAETLRFVAAPGGTCAGGDASCTSVCTADCTGHGAFTGAACTIEETTVPTPGSCVTRALTRPRMSAARRTQQEAIVSRIEASEGGQPRATWTCQSLSSDQINADRCVPLGCEGAPFCCMPGTGSAPVTTSEGGATGATSPETIGPSCWCNCGTGAAEVTRIISAPGGTCTGGDSSCTASCTTECTGHGAFSGASCEAGSSATTACAQLAVTRGTTQATVDAVAARTGTDPSVWACKRVCLAAQRENCVQHGCPDSTDTNVLCCPPSIGQPVGQTCGGRGASGSTNGTGSTGGIGIARLILPECATTRDPARAGKCQIADVFDLGYAAVRFMFGLSGALLLLAFVVSGFKYLVSGYAGDIKSAKATMINATLGIVIMLFAYIMVNFLYTSLTGNDGSTFTGENTSSETPAPTTQTNPRSSTPGGAGTTPGGGSTASGPSGTCRCAPSGLASVLVGAATADQIAQARTACTSARAGAVFDPAAFTCTGPTTESECRAVETAIGSQLPTGITVSCAWTR